MFFVKTRTLQKIALIGAGVCLTCAVYAVRKAQTIYRDSPFFKEALSIVESHEGVKMLLGTPLAGYKVTYVPPEDEAAPTSIGEFSARVKGPKGYGSMFFWAERIEDGDSIQVNIKRIELQTDSDQEKRLVVKAA